VVLTAVQVQRTWGYRGVQYFFIRVSLLEVTTMRMQLFSKLILISSLFSFGIIGHAFAGSEDTHAGQAVNNGVQASGHASASAAHSIIASGQVVSAAAVVPLSIGGAVLVSGGIASAGAAHGSAKAASAPIGTPLEITDEAIVTMPPNEALKTNAQEKKSEKKI
jgi:hypothetical protein